MTRVRYKNNADGTRVSNPMMAGNRQVVVQDYPLTGNFQIYEAGTVNLLAQDGHKNSHVRMRLIKAHLTRLGVLFQTEVRKRLEKTEQEVA